MPFRFVHTAGIHLDSPLRSLALRDPDLAALIGGATRRAFENIVELCLEEQVDALMIAGDLYDGGQTSVKTALFLAAQLERLDDAGVRTFIVRGNHDAESRIKLEPVLPERVKVFGGRVKAVEIDRPDGALPVAVHGVSFAKQKAPDLVPKFKPPVAGAFNIGLLHTSLAGAPGHDPYAPCAVGDLVDHGFDYWCLGHVHKRAVHNETPHVVMPGMPQGRDIGEAGPKSVTLVHVGDDRSVECMECLVNVAQFERVNVNLAGAEEPREMARRIGERLDKLRAVAEAEHLVVRLELTGGTPLNWQLRREPEWVETEARHRADMAGNAWIEKVEIATEDPGGVGTAPGALEELANDMRGPIARSEADDDTMKEIEKALPLAVRRAFGNNDERRRTLDDLITEGRQAVLAHLREGAVDGGAD